MNELSQNTYLNIKSALKAQLSFDAIKEALGNKNLKSAQYLCLIKLIESFVLSIVSSFSKEKVLKTEITLNEIKRMLNYKDLRSVSNWCKKNDVFIISQGNAQFVNRHQFSLAFYKPFLSKLKLNHINWKELFVQYMQRDMMGLLNKENSTEQILNYKPKSEIEKSFLNKIKGL